MTYTGPDEKAMWDKWDGPREAAGEPWLAVRTRVGREREVARRLVEQGAAEVFAPWYEVEVRHARRVRVAERALYPGYCFLRPGRDFELCTVRTTPGAVDVVPSAYRPWSMADAVLAPVRRRAVAGGLLVLTGLERRRLAHLGEALELTAGEMSAEALERVAAWVAGKTLLPVVDGPLEGLMGTFAGLAGGGRIRLEVGLFQRLVCVPLCLSQLGEPA